MCCLVSFSYVEEVSGLASWEVFRVYRLLERSAEGCPGHGPVHLLLQSAAVIGFRWDSLELAWDRPGLPLLSNLSGSFQHFRAAILGAWRDAVSSELCARNFFRGSPLFDIDGTLQLLNSDHVRERDKALLRSILVGSVWNGFLLGKVRGQDVPCRFCGAPDHDGHLFWDCTFPPHVEIREHPEFHDLIELDKTSWYRCRLWNGWLPLLSGFNGGSPWAQPLLKAQLIFLNVLLGGRYSSGQLAEWQLGRILDGKLPSRPFELLPDGDLLFLIDRVLRIRGLGSVRVSKVKGHADEAMVRAGTVRGLEKLGNDGADEAADFGRRRVPWWVTDARRNLSGVCSRWRPVVLVLHRFTPHKHTTQLTTHTTHTTRTQPTTQPLQQPPQPTTHNNHNNQRRRLVHAVRDRVLFTWAA